MLVSTSRTFPSRKSVVVWLLETARTIHQRAAKTSLLRLLSSTTLDRSALDTLQFWIATLLTLLANSLSLRRRSTVVQVRRWKTTPSSSSPSTRQPERSDLTTVQPQLFTRLQWTGSISCYP